MTDEQEPARDGPAPVRVTVDATRVFQSWSRYIRHPSRFHWFSDQAKTRPTTTTEA
jgi:hypothetical protein